MPELCEQPAQAVQRRGSLLHESLAHAVQRQVRLLLDALDRYETHVRSGDGLADRLSIITVVLAALAIRSHEFRGHQLHDVTEHNEPPRPLVRTGAGFHTD